MSELVVETTDLRRTFGKEGAIEAVAGVDLQVEAGSIFGFLGPNGAGKTTTLRILATLLPPTSGVARVMGADVATRARGTSRRRIGYVAQSGGTDPGCRPRRARHAGPPVRSLEPPIRATARPSCSTRVGARRGGRPCDQHLLRAACAAGSTSRWAWSIARACCSSTSRRPASTRRRAPTCGTRSAGSAIDGTSVFLTTHYLDEADALCDRLAIIDHGRIVAEGTADELKRAVAGDVVTIGVDGSAELVARLLGDAAVRPRGGHADGVVRLYVDDGEAEPPARAAAARRPGPRAPDARAPPPQPRRRVPPPDRPLAARRSRLSRPDPSRPSERTPPCACSPTPGSSSADRSA